ncbi:MAG: tetratricopeptide repeat protein [Fuerstiella sp.]
MKPDSHQNKPTSIQQAPAGSTDIPQESRGLLRRSAILALCGIATSLAVWLWPVDLSRQFQTGLDAAEQGEWKTVRSCVKQLQQNHEFQEHAVLLQALELLARKRPEEALIAFSKARTHPDTREIAFKEAARLLYDAGQFSQTIQMCQQVLFWNPECTETRRLLAAAYYDIGAMVQAINALSVLIEQQPRDHRPHYMQASILHDFERFEDAALAYEQAALRLDGASIVRDEVLAGWGACLIRLRRHEQALRVMQPAGHWPEVETQRALAHFALRHHDAALTAAESALKELPLHPEAAAVAAQCYELAGNVAKGISLLQQAAAKHPYELELQLRLADMLGADGQTEAALQHRQLAGQITDYRRDFSHKQQALIHDDDDPQLRFEIGQLAEKLGKIDIARSWFKAAVGMTNASEEIRSYWQQFQAMHPNFPASPATSMQVY